MYCTRLELLLFLVRVELIYYGLVILHALRTSEEKGSSSYSVEIKVKGDAT